QRDSIYLYFQRCLSIHESQDVNDFQLPIDYKQLISIKTLETLESLLEWFYLNEEIITQIMFLATRSPLNLESNFAYKLKLHSYRCIQAVVKQSNPNRAEDAAIIGDLFHDCSPDRFINFLVTNVLSSYLNHRHPIESHSQLFELFILVLEIAVDIIC